MLKCELRDNRGKETINDFRLEGGKVENRKDTEKVVVQKRERGKREREIEKGK